MGERDKTVDATEREIEMPSPMSVTPLNRTPNAPHVVFFNIDSLISMFSAETFSLHKTSDPLLFLIWLIYCSWSFN